MLGAKWQTFADAPAPEGCLWRSTRSFRPGDRLAAYAHQADFHDTVNRNSHPHREETS